MTIAKWQDMMYTFTSSFFSSADDMENLLALNLSKLSKFNRRCGVVLAGLRGVVVEPVLRRPVPRPDGVRSVLFGFKRF